MEKQIAYYSDKDACIVVGTSGYLFVDEHPNSRLNGKCVRTSKVLSKNIATGDFETNNTIYKYKSLDK